MTKSMRTRKYKNRQSWLQKHMRWVIISIIVVVVAAVVSVALSIIYGGHDERYDQAVIKVNDVTLDMRYYVDMLENYYGLVPASALYDFTDYGDLEIEQFAGYVEQQIVHNQVVKQGSAALGVKIKRSAVETELKNSGIQVTDARTDLLMVQELIEKQVPSAQPQYHVQAMLLESESAAQEAKARLDAGESFQQVAGDVSKAPLSAIVDGDLGWVTAREADLTVGSTRFSDMISGANVGVFSEPMYDDSVSKQFGYWAIKVMEKNDTAEETAESIRINGILVGSEQEADIVRERLYNGEDPDALAMELSQIPDVENRGAELGWITIDEDASDFDVLFDLPLNGISMPIGDDRVKTKGGYWIFNILEKDENRALTTDQQDVLVNDLLERCSEELEKDPDYLVEKLLTEEMRVFAISEVILSQGEGSVIIRTSSLEHGVAGKSYSLQLEIYGDTNDNTWSITKGYLPEGMILNESTGLISGTPVNAGGYSFTIKVSNDLHYWEQEYFLKIQLPLSVRTESLPDGQVGDYYSAALDFLGDSTTYTWSIIDGSLPDGLNLAKSSGIIGGYPTTAGTYDFTMEIDIGLQKATRTLSIHVTEETASAD